MAVTVVAKLGATLGYGVLDNFGKGLDFTGRPTNWTTYGSFQAGAGVDNLLLETGDALLLETGDALLLE